MKPLQPDFPCSDRRFAYTPANSTNIRARFKAAGMKTKEEAEAEERLEYAIRAVRNFPRGQANNPS